MRRRSWALAAVALLALGACGAEPAAAPSTPVASKPPPSVMEARCPTSETELLALARGEVVVSPLGRDLELAELRWCFIGNQTTAGYQLEGRVLAEPTAVREALAKLDQSGASAESCPAGSTQPTILVAKPKTGAPFLVAVPQDGCGRPLAAVTTALSGAKFTKVESYLVPFTCTSCVPK